MQILFLLPRCMNGRFDAAGEESEGDSKALPRGTFHMALWEQSLLCFCIESVTFDGMHRGNNHGVFLTQGGSKFEQDWKIRNKILVRISFRHCMYGDSHRPGYALPYHHKKYCG